MSCASLNCEGFRMFRLRACPDHKWLTDWSFFSFRTQMNSEFCASQCVEHLTEPTSVEERKARTLVPCSDYSAARQNRYISVWFKRGPLSHLDQVPAQVICRKKQAHSFRVASHESDFTTTCASQYCNPITICQNRFVLGAADISHQCWWNKIPKKLRALAEPTTKRLLPSMS